MFPTRTARQIFVASLTVAALAGCSGSSGGYSAQEAPPTTSRPAVAPPPETARPSVGVATASPVRVGKPAALSADVEVTVGALRSIKVTANGPGEIAGPAVAVRLTVKNASATAFDCQGLVVNASYGKGTPAVPSDAAPAKRVTGTVAPGKSVVGEYVFLAPSSALATLKIEVSSNNARKVVTFRQ